MQIISTIPYFYKKDIGLSEFEIGMLMALNGLLIFIFEMPLIKWIESKSYTKIGLMIFGLLLTSISFLLLIVNPWLGFIVISMILLTFGEMIVFPFSNAFALIRAKRGLKGEYMALYSIAFSISHIFAHNLGFHLIEKLGFHKTWGFMSILALVGLGLLIYLKSSMNRTTQIVTHVKKI
ncbi:MAG: MFS transporter [Gelidibacter sp.]